MSRERNDSGDELSDISSEASSLSDRVPGRARHYPTRRLIWLALGLAILFLIPFLIWGKEFGAWFSAEGAIRRLRAWGPLGGLAVVGLLVSDLFLPVPTTGIMSAAGYLYGVWMGGACSAVGSMLSGLIAYWLCLVFGRRVAGRLAGAKDLSRGEALFRRGGA